MDKETVKLILLALPSILAAIASLVAAIRIKSVHHLVNSQYSNVLQRLQDAMEKIVTLSPTDDNKSEAKAARLVVSDHKLK